MKKTLLTAAMFVFALCTFAAPPAGWMTDLSKAQAAALKQKKPLFILVTGSTWCPPCKALQRNVISQKAFRDVVKKNAIGVYLDLPRRGMTPALRASIQKLTFFRGGVPAFAVTDPELKILAVPGRRDIQSFNAAIQDGTAKMRKFKAGK